MTLGVLVPGYDGAVSSIRACAERAGLAWHTISVADVPVGAVLENPRGSHAWSRFSITVRLYHERAGYAQSVGRVFLLANGCEYPKAKYLESVSGVPASVSEKVGFLVGNRAQSAAIVLDSLGLAERLRRLMARRPLSPLARAANFIFAEWQDIRIPLTSLGRARDPGRKEGVQVEGPGGLVLEPGGSAEQEWHHELVRDQVVTRVGRSKARQIAREMGRSIG